MKKIGGMFYYEPCKVAENGYFERVCPPDGDLAFTMSGRCGLYYCLEDIMLQDTRRVAYIPMYTCETVLSSYEKAGYQLKFYDIDENLRIVILEDVTHSMLSADGIDPLCDYFAGSFRKWMGIACGGIAVKRNGKFAKPLLPVDPTHLRQREAAIETAESDVFWEGEMRLRQMFDSFAGDERSEYILRHADFDAICAARRANFSAILNGLPKELHGIRPVFPILTGAAVPSHFCLYAERRDEFQAFLAERQIRSTVYWPVGPMVHPEGHPSVTYIYDHIVSVPCDQRYQPSDMQRVAEAFAAYSENFGR